MARRSADPVPPGDVAGSATTRERILDVALDLFVRKGYAETSLREIAAELGFSKAALYYHFESKQEMLLALHLRVHALTDDLLPLLESEAGPDAGVDDLWGRLVERLIELALRKRRLIELHIRNRAAIGDLHGDAAALARHGPIEQDIEQRVVGLLSDRSGPLERRVRRLASLGAIGAVLLGAESFADVSDGDLEEALRAVTRDVLS